MITTINEYKKQYEYQVYHNTYNSAIDEVTKYIKNMGYTYNDDSFTNTYIDGFFKPKDGKTKKDSFTLYKDDKEMKKLLHVQIYNRGNDKFELNMYIN